MSKEEDAEYVKEYIAELDKQFDLGVFAFLYILVPSTNMQRFCQFAASNQLCLIKKHCYSFCFTIFGHVPRWHFLKYFLVVYLKLNVLNESADI